MCTKGFSRGILKPIDRGLYKASNPHPAGSSKEPRARLRLTSQTQSSFCGKVRLFSLLYYVGVAFPQCSHLEFLR